jgi:exosortase A-associated hydrolase 2
MAPQPQPFFLSVAPADLGRRFALYHAPHDVEARGLVVYVHPLAEEMNKSRRMAALQSRAFAAQGFAVLQMDLLGCGDSAGDFSDATWARWVSDVADACSWLRRRHTPPLGTAAPPLWLWGLRVGCLLAAEAATRLEEGCNFVFWQPTLVGNMALQQFLRLKLAGDMLAGNAKGAMAALRQQLARGQPTEIAGYMLNPALADGLEQAVLRPPPPPGRVDWLDVSASPEGGLPPAASRVVEQWNDAGWDVRTQVVPGPSFWQTTEIEEAPALVVATSAALEQPRAPNEAAGSAPSSSALLREGGS